jgi:membrane dipeptidase
MVGGGQAPSASSDYRFIIFWEHKHMIVDGHEDIAYNVLVHRRDFTASLTSIRAREGQSQPDAGICTVSLPELLTGGIGLVFGTLFTLPAHASNSKLQGDHVYRNPEEAHRQALAQLVVYQSLAQREDVRIIRNRGDLRALQADQQAGKSLLGIVLLMENADPIRTPNEAAWWFEQGVRIVGPAWQATRYCGGTRQPGPLTADGRALMQTMAESGLILDISHMAEESFWQALELFPGTVIASHSNCRSFVSEAIADRHLSDAMIRALIERDAVIGSVLYSRFLVAADTRNLPKTAIGLDAVLRHIDHICQIAGNVRHVAIGSDLDGGFGSEATPSELDSVADLPLIGSALGKAGYSQIDVEAIMGGNWLRLLEQALPPEH